MKKARDTLILGLGIAMLSLAAMASPTRSLTKYVGGYSYKLTTPKPLHMGQQTLKLRIIKGSQPVNAAQLKAEIRMADGMKAPVQIKNLGTGEYLLTSHFSMGGAWMLTLQQIKPTPVQLNFSLEVAGGHAHH